MKLTEKQRRFIEYYIELGNATEAAIQAGYSKKTAKETGYENLTKRHIKSHIDKRMKEITDKRIMGQREALELLTSIARAEIIEELYIPTEMGVKRIEKIPDIKDRQKAIESILKRYPNSKHDELKDKLLEAQINKIKAETKNEETGTTKTIVLTNEDEMRRVITERKAVDEDD